MKVVYKSGKHNADCDALSRYSTASNEPEPEVEDEEEKIFAFLTLQVYQFDHELRQEQENYPYVKGLKLSLENKANLPIKTQRRLERYKVIDGLLHKIVKRPYETTWNVVIPQKCRLKILKAFHDDVLSGHSGYQKIYEKISSRFTWPKMTTHINDYVKRCAVCEANKRGPAPLDAPLQSITASFPWQKASIDLVGRVETARRRRYVCMCTCLFTRYSETRAMNNQKASTIARFLIEQVMSRHGCPEILISDNGK